MGAPPLRVAILWHMHQPDYRDRIKGRAVLPWVRLHAIKDYYPMAALVDEFPELRVTFNYVPSLLEQLEDYVAGRLPDEHLVISEAPAADLDEAGRNFLLRGFFMANHETMIGPHPRYHELAEKRGPGDDKRSLESARRRFSVKDCRDLQVWFNLVWFGPYFLRSHPLLIELQEKGQGFTEEEKAGVLALQREVAGRVLPLLRRLAAEGRIEISTTPHCHPILPLLVDTDVARVSTPEAVLPRQPFRHPEDALGQVRKAAAYHERLFGVRARGIWPSEGSVSRAVLEMLSGEGFRWTATDENILFRSLGHPLTQEFYRTGRREDVLYQPFRLEGPADGTAVFFRDHLLSDLIGFSYSRWGAEDAVDDFMNRIGGIAALHGGPKEGRVVSVILDGENAWEYYPDGGLAFLRGLYGRLCTTPGVRSTTFSGYLREGAPPAPLHDIFPGSWINNNFAIWIGHREDNRAWDLLTTTRETLVAAEAAGRVDPERLGEAWEELYMAEGSDWCWWYGDDHTSGNDEIFDELYRRHLMNVHRLVGAPIPDELAVSVIDGARARAATAPDEVVSLIAPRIDGIVTSYFEWLGATSYEVHRRGQTMHRTDVPVSMVHFGISQERLFVRVDFRVGYHDPALIGDAVVVEVAKPRRVRIVIPMTREGRGGWSEDLVTGARRNLAEGEAAIGDILEAGFGWRDLNAKRDDRVEFTVSLIKDEKSLAVWPMTGAFAVTVPGPDFEMRMWSV